MARCAVCQVSLGLATGHVLTCGLASSRETTGCVAVSSELAFFGERGGECPGALVPAPEAVADPGEPVAVPGGPGDDRVASGGCLAEGLAKPAGDALVEQVEPPFADHGNVAAPVEVSTLPSRPISLYTARLAGKRLQNPDSR